MATGLEPNHELPVFEQDEAIARHDNDPQFLCEMIGFGVPEIREAVERFERHTETENWPEATRAVHSIKGLMLQLGGTRAASLAAQMEAMSRQQSGDVRESIAPLRQVIATTERELQAFANRYEP